MTTVIKYSELVCALDQQFPDFGAYLGDGREAVCDHASVYFSFFSIYLKEHWSNEALHAQLAPLLLLMHTSADEATQVTLNDFLLDVCSSCKEHGLDLHLMLQQLTPELRQRLLQLNNHWLAAACQLPRGGCC